MLDRGRNRRADRWWSRWEMLVAWLCGETRELDGLGYSLKVQRTESAGSMWTQGRERHWGQLLDFCPERMNMFITVTGKAEVETYFWVFWLFIYWEGRDLEFRPGGVKFVMSEWRPRGKIKGGVGGRGGGVREKRWGYNCAPGVRDRPEIMI